MAVENGNTVKILYKGTFENGEVFDSSDLHNNEPLEFTVGKKQVIPGFENAVIGKELNDEISVKIEPKDGYGEYNKEAVQEINRSELPLDMDPKLGMVLQVQHQHGDHNHDIPAWITKVEDTSITLDFNHPLAGKVLNFEITIKDISSE